MNQRKRAKVLASLAKSSPLVVFAGTEHTASVNDLKGREFLHHECASCGTELAFGTEAEGLQPFCPTCGGSHFEAVASEPIPVDDLLHEDDFSVARCPGCGTANALDDRVLAGLKGHLHCAACGCSLEVAAVDEDDNIYDVNASEDIDGEDEPEDQSTEEGSEGAEDEEGVDDESESDEEVARFGKRRRAIKASENTNSDLDAEKVKRLSVGDNPTNTNEGLDADVSDNGVVNTNPGLNAETADDINVDMLENTEVDDQVDIIQGIDPIGQTQLLAFAGGVHVATLTAEDAGENADLIGRRHFREALESEAAANGAKCLAAYGFKPVVAKISIASLVEKRVQAALSKQEANLKAAHADVRDDFKQSMQIALAALNSGFYRNRPNPLAVSLVASLEAMGVKQAKSVVTRAMQTASGELIDETLALTDEIMQKPLELRNELADTLSEVEPTVVLPEDACADGDDEDPQDDTVVARLSRGGRVVASKTAETASASALNISGLVAQARATQTK